MREQIGCVIVDTRQRVLATSYTGPPAGYPLHNDQRCDSFCERARSGPTPESARSYSDCVSSHAELNGLLMTDRTSREGGSLYVTSYPCWGCAKAIASSGLSRVYLVGAEGAEYREPGESVELLRICGLRVIRL